MTKQKKKAQPNQVALLVGGWSAEREVSLEKGQHVEKALRDAGYNVKLIEVEKDINVLIQALTPRPDVVFNNLYGRGGEDGTIQALLDIMELPYTHSGVLASAVAMDKAMTKRLAEACGVSTPRWAIVPAGELAAQNQIGIPYVIKPVNEGSSVDVHIITADSDAVSQNNSDMAKILKESGGYDKSHPYLVEEYIPGRELTVAVLDGKPQAVTEIHPEKEFFNYESKYGANGMSTTLPARIPENVYNKALENAALIFTILGCRGLARCDFRYNDTGQGPQGLYFLEINTQPGLTAESIGPSQLVYQGMSFPDLCSYLVQTADFQRILCPASEKKAPARKDKDLPLSARKDSSQVCLSGESLEGSSG